MKKHLLQSLATIFFLQMFFSTKTNAQWGELGRKNSSTFNGNITCIVTDTQNNIYAGGAFANAKGKYYVAKWNGNNWSELGGTNTSTFNSGINCMTTDKYSNIYVAGSFTNRVSHGNGNNCYVAKWNGSSWSELGGTNTSTFNSYINSVTSDASGNIYVAGNFTNAIGKYYVAEWNGSSWSELGGINTSTFDVITQITTDANGNVYATGQFTNTNGKYYIAKWNGITWSELGGTNTSTFNGSVTSLTTDVIGNLYAAGTFTNTNGKYYLAKWNGNSWGELGGINTSTFNKTIYNIFIDSRANIYAGGLFTNTNGKYYLAQWSGSNWGELGGANTSTFNNLIYTINTDSSGNIYAGGFFTNDSSNFYVAKYTRTSLPLKLLSISINIQENKDIYINWQTVSETNNSRFIIQHSTEATSFIDIGTVKAIGSGANSYEFTDTKPANGINYYRLQSVDKDGSSTYSKLVSVNFGDKESFSIIPNPAKDFATISFNKTVDKATIAVYDLTGKEVITQSLNASTNTYKLNTQSLKSGVYVVKVKTATGSYNEKLLISK